MAISDALDMAQNVYEKYEAALPNWLERGDHRPVRVDISPLKRLGERLDQLKPSLKKEQIYKIKNIVSKMKLYVIKNAYLMKNDNLMTTVASGPNYRGIVDELIRIVRYVPEEFPFELDILTSPRNMSPKFPRYKSPRRASLSSELTNFEPKRHNKLIEKK